MTDETIAEIDAHPGDQGSRDHAGLSAGRDTARCQSLPTSKPIAETPTAARVPRMSRSSWTATAAGRRRAACRAARAIGAASKRSARRSGGHRPRHRLSDAVQLLLGKLVAAAGGSRFPVRPVPPLHPSRRRRASCGRACSISVIGKRDGAACRHTRHDRGGRKADGRRTRSFSSSSPSTTAPATRSCARSARIAGEVQDGRLDPAAISEATIAAHLDTAALSRPGSRHPHQRRTPAQQLPALAVGLRRARFRAGLLAGLRPRGARRARSRNSPARSRRYGGTGGRSAP